MKKNIMIMLLLITISLIGDSPLEKPEEINNSLDLWPFLATPFIHLMNDRVVINGTYKKLFIYDLGITLARDLRPRKI